MKSIKFIATVAILAVAATAWAGGPIPPQPAPVLGEHGLVALGVGLIGAGAMFLRKR